eukprot:gene7067-16783_t
MEFLDADGDGIVMVAEISRTSVPQQYSQIIASVTKEPIRIDTNDLDKIVSETYVEVEGVLQRVVEAQRRAKENEDVKAPKLNAKDEPNATPLFSMLEGPDYYDA